VPIVGRRTQRPDVAVAHSGAETTCRIYAEVFLLCSCWQYSTAGVVCNCYCFTGPKYIECPKMWGSPSLVRGGGISGCPDWQAQLVRELKDVDLVLVNPRRKVFDVQN